MYIYHVKPALASSLDEIYNRVITDYEGVQTCMDIHVIQMLCQVMDKGGDGKAIILLENEDVVTSGPFLKTVELPNRYVSLKM